MTSPPERARADIVSPSRPAKQSRKSPDATREGRKAQPPGPRFQHLVVAIQPGERPAKAIVLAAVAALSGLRFDGQAMPESFVATYGEPGWASVTDIARELGQHRNTVSRELDRLAHAGEVDYCEGRASPNPDTLAARAAAPGRLYMKIGKPERCARLPALQLALSGLVAGQARNGRLAAGLGRLVKWTGASRSTVIRALDALQAAGHLHRWTVPVGRGQLVLAIGPAPALPQDDTGAPQDDTGAPQDDTGRRPRMAPVVPQDDTRNSGLRQDSDRIHQESQACAAAHDREPGAAPGAAPDQQPDADPVAAWLRRHVVAEHLDDLAAASLLRVLGVGSPQPDQVARLRRWCPSVERLGRWCARVRRWYRPRNLAQYLLRASQRGDPGTVFAATGGDVVRDFGDATEQALVGPRQSAVLTIVRDIADRTPADTPERRRARARIQVAVLRREHAVAAATIVQTIGTRPSPESVAALLEGITGCGPALALLEGRA